MTQLSLALLLSAGAPPSFEATLRQADAVVVYPAAGPSSPPLRRLAERLASERLVRSMSDAEAEGLDPRVPVVLLGGPRVNILARRVFVPPDGLVLARDGFIVDGQTWSEPRTLVLWSMRSETGVLRSVLLTGTIEALQDLDAVDSAFGHGYCVLESGRATLCGSTEATVRIDVPHTAVATSAGQGVLDRSPPLPGATSAPPAARPAPPIRAPRAGEPSVTVAGHRAQPVSALPGSRTGRFGFGHVAIVGAGQSSADYPATADARTLAVALVAETADRRQLQAELDSRVRAAKQAGVGGLVMITSAPIEGSLPATAVGGDLYAVVATTALLAPTTGVGDPAVLMRSELPRRTGRTGELRVPAAAPPQHARAAGTSISMRAPDDPLRDVREAHLRNVRQLTFGGDNAEAYWSPDGLMLVMQSTYPPYECDQIFVMPVATGEMRLVSTGRGRATCAYYVPSPLSIVFSSTHHVDPGCPPPPDDSRGAVRSLYPYDIFSVRTDGTGLRTLTDGPGYDAEATVSNDGGRIVFTSTRDGDLDLYTMNIDGSDVRRITKTLGYDGGAFFSPDDTRLVYRAHHPDAPAEVARYRELLEAGLLEPSQLDIMVVDSDGENARKVTSNAAADFGAYWHPDGRRIIFSSNLHDERNSNFDLYMIRDDGTDLERITWDETFDGYPMFSPDGTQLVFASNRNSVERGETNVFVADWVP